LAKHRKTMSFAERFESKFASYKSAPFILRIKALFSKFEYSSEANSAWIVLYLIMFIIMFLRMPDTLINGHLRAEDGPIFLQQAIEHSYLSLITLYAGYLHIIPRLVTLFALQFGLKTAPFIMDFSAMLIAVASISYIFSTDFRFLIKNDVWRFITAIFIICMPVPDIFLNITNIQWPLSIYLMLWTTNLILGSGSTTPAKTLFAILGFLTSPVSVIFLPAVAWFVYKSRSIPILVVFLISVLCNIFYLAVGSMEGQDNPRLISIVRFISAHIFTNFYFYPASDIINQYGYHITYLITIITISILIYYSRNNWTIDAWIWYLFISYVLLIAIARSSYINDSDLIMRSTRFFFMPLCLLLILCVRHACKKNYLIYLIMIIFIINIASNYSITPYEDFDFKLSAEKFNASGECSCIIPINPTGWFFTVPCSCTSLDAFSWCNKGFILDYQRKYDEAIDAYDEAIELDPNYAKAWNSKGITLSKQNKLNEGIKCFDEATRLDPNYADAWKNKGIVLYGQGKYDEAVKAFDEATKIDPKMIIAWNNKGNALGKQGKFVEAIEAYDEAIRIDPKNAVAQKNKGKILTVLGRTP